MNMQYFGVNLFATGTLSYMFYYFKFQADQHPLMYLVMAASSVLFINYFEVKKEISYLMWVQFIAGFA